MTSDDYQTSLADELNNTIDKLHSLFNDIGIAQFDRDHREAKLYEALNAALHEQLHLVAQEKNALIDDCQKAIAQMQQMERSLSGEDDDAADDTSLRVTLPLTKCLSGLKERQKGVKRRHAERYDSIKKLVQALNRYASKLEPSTVQIPLPPITNDSAAAASFDLSNAYYDRLEREFNRVYNEYTRRSATVTNLAHEIIKLYADLGTPAAQIDQTIIQCANSEPERLGLTKDDIDILGQKKARLVEEREIRQARVAELKGEVGKLWEKLGMEERDRKMFLAQHRGYDLKCIQELEDELDRLLQLKRENLHIFVEDARYQIQELWAKLYVSEDEMADFSPMRSDVMTDALLSAHEMEITRLQSLLQEHEPMLAMVNKHKSLLNDKEQLAISSTDASRLMSRGGNRDPTRLLREEKMRKRIQRDLPKVEVELKQKLEKYEEDHGVPFLVYGESYLDVLIASSSVCQSRMGSSMGNRSTPAPDARPLLRGRSNTVSAASNQLSRSRSVVERQPARSKTPTGFARPKTPTGFARPKTPGIVSGTMSINRASGRNVASQLDRSSNRTPAPGTRVPQPSSSTGNLRPKTPTGFARPPLTNFSNNPERPFPPASSTATITRSQSAKVRKPPSLTRLVGPLGPPPPRMNQLGPASAPLQSQNSTPARAFLAQQRERERESEASASSSTSSRIRSVSPYSDDHMSGYSQESVGSGTFKKPPSRQLGTFMEMPSPARSARAERERSGSVISSNDERHSSIASGSTLSTVGGTSGSENWETYGESDGEHEPVVAVVDPDQDDEDADARAAYYRNRERYTKFAVKQQTAPLRGAKGRLDESVEEWTSDEEGY